MSNFLYLISVGQEIIIPACDGTQTIAESSDLFTGFLDPNFKNWGLDKASQASAATPVEIHELGKNGRFGEIFSSVTPADGDLKKLCLTQHQIKSFCRVHQDLLHEGSSTFLFEENDDFFVAFVGEWSGRLGVCVYQFSYGRFWYDTYYHRFVIPRLLSA